MQPIRYYITKSGDEPTVRSVKVSLGATEVEERADTRATTPATAAPVAQEAAAESGGVKRRVQDVIRKRAKAI